MEVKALVLAGGADPAGERFADMPFALADVVGCPAVHHLVAHLRRQGVSDAVVISEFPAPSLSSSCRKNYEPPRWIFAAGGQMWRVAENLFHELAQNGAEEILVVRAGAYVEPDVDDLLQAHNENRTHATRALDTEGEPMDVFAVTASRRNEAAYLFRHGLSETRTRCGSWRFRGYRNALQTAQHLRCLAVDAFLGENSIVPAAAEIRPGVWIARGASVHPRARVLAPAFIGEGTRVRANAVVTRCSVIERRCDIGVGSVVEDASVLPYTSIGGGLDVMHAVAGSRRLASLEHDIAIEIADPRLMSELPRRVSTRALAHAAALVSFLLPSHFSKRFSRAARARSAELPEAVAAPAALDAPPGFPATPSAVQVSSRTWQ
jgi:NDP-sugar pyrophosphorylase family protein